VSTYFVVCLDMICESLDVHLHVSTLVGDSVIVDRFYCSRVMTFIGYKTWVDLTTFYMHFVIILVMSLLSQYHAISYCNAKIVYISMLGMLRLE